MLKKKESSNDLVCGNCSHVLLEDGKGNFLHAMRGVNDECLFKSKNNLCGCEDAVPKMDNSKDSDSQGIHFSEGALKALERNSERLKKNVEEEKSPVTPAFEEKNSEEEEPVSVPSSNVLNEVDRIFRSSGMSYVEIIGSLDYLIFSYSMESYYLEKKNKK